MPALLLPLLIGLTTAAALPPDVVVVCPAEFRETMQPWLASRRQQGHTVEFVSNTGAPVEIRERIRDAAKLGKLKFVLLVGDAPTEKSTPAELALRTPTFRVPAKMDRAWGGGPDFATDNPYADLDDDRVPDVAVGRLTAHTADELRVMIQKILDYEQSQNFGPWRSRINFVAGEAGYGAVADSTLEAAVRHLICGALPREYQTSMTYASWRSPFCPDPRSFHTRTLDRINEGCLFWVFMGHGSPRTLQWAAFPDGVTLILRCEDCAGLHCQGMAPIALCMCCYTGAFADDNDCLAEDLLRAAGGPVAVFSGSSVTMPYGMVTLGQQAIGEYFEHPSDTLGEWLLKTKRDTVAGYNLPIWALANSAEEAFFPNVFLPKEERLEHLQLFNLFGDPTMRLAHPQAVELKLPKTAVAGNSVVITGNCAVHGEIKVELVTPLERIQSLSREIYDSSAKGRQQFEADYRTANGAPLAVKTTTAASDGKFALELPLPENLSGVYRIRAFVQGDSAFGLGCTDFSILPAKATTRVKEQQAADIKNNSN